MVSIPNNNHNPDEGRVKVDMKVDGCEWETSTLWLVSSSFKGPVSRFGTRRMIQRNYFNNVSDLSLLQGIHRSSYYTRFDLIVPKGETSPLIQGPSSRRNPILFHSFFLLCSLCFVDACLTFSNTFVLFVCSSFSEVCVVNVGTIRTLLWLGLRKALDDDIPWLRLSVRLDGCSVLFYLLGWACLAVVSLFSVSYMGGTFLMIGMLWTVWAGHWLFFLMGYEELLEWIHGEPCTFLKKIPEQPCYVETIRHLWKTFLVI